MMLGFVFCSGFALGTISCDFSWLVPAHAAFTANAPFLKKAPGRHSSPAAVSNYQVTTYDYYYYYYYYHYYYYEY